jgi:hypothetical protein
MSPLHWGKFEKRKIHTKMGFIKGLAAVNEELAKRPSGDFADRPKARYVNIDDGDSAKLVFLQEIDEGSPNYLKENGTGLFALMHKSPTDFRKSAQCTADLGECYGCSQGWNQSTMLFLNVLVDDGKEEPYVAIFNRGIGKGSVAQSLLNMAGDEDFDFSITDKTFKLSRKGVKKETTYSLDALPKPHGKDLSEYTDKLFDLEQYVFTVKPEKQEAYYGGEDFSSNKDEAPKKPATAAAIDADW